MARNRSSTVQLSRLFGSASAPIYVLDAERKIVHINDALAAWLAVDAEALLGRTCNFTTISSEERLEKIAAALCPPPEVFAGKTVAATLSIDFPEAVLQERRVQFFPLGESLTTCAGVVAVLSAADLSPQDSPHPDGTITPTIDEAAELHRRLTAYGRTMAGSFRLERLVGDSPPTVRVREQVLAAIAGQVRTVVVGPVGSGREQIARTIHYAGSEQTAPPLVPLACPLLDAELLQTTVTSFVRRCAREATSRPGALLLLDVDGLSPEAQSELAGFLALPNFELHTLCTARRSLLACTVDGSFRRDLAFALSTIEIEVTPLVERRDDIPLLAQMFVEIENARGVKQSRGFAPDAVDVLCSYSWPENLDQLAAVVHESHQRSAGYEIAVADLPERLHLSAEAATQPRRLTERIILDEFLANIERQLIARAMRRVKGNKSKAAKLLGISRPRLMRRIEQLGVALES